MLDLITLISTMGVQSELQERKVVAITAEEGEENTFVEQAADSLSSAFDSLEGAVSEGISSIFGSAEPVPSTPKKVD